MELFGRSRRRLRSLNPKRKAYQFGFERCEERFLLTAYVVDSNADDLSGFFDSSSGIYFGTLRYVLTQLPGTGTATNTIDFQIGLNGGPATINLVNGNLPEITRQVTIDGLNWAGFFGNNPRVPVQVDQNGYNALTFDFGSQGSVLQTLSIYGGGTTGSAAVSINTSNVTLTGNYLGVHADGVTTDPSRYGVYITGSGNRVNGSNIIGGNTVGVEITGSGATGNVVTGNFIGTNPNGADLGNTDSGVKLESRAFGNTVGPDNTIGFNDVHGVHILGSGATANVVTGNFIGTNSSGANLGNGIDGVRIETLATGNFIESGNTIGFNVYHAIHINDGANHNEVIGNYLGTDANGADLGNLLGGVYIDGASNNWIGRPDLGNVISGNGASGIQILGGSFTGSSYPSDGNVINDNKIGTDRDVATALPNTIGVEIRGATNTQIGGLDECEGNWISGNTVAGISITGLEATGNSIVANYIGTDLHGVNAIPNGVSTDFDTPGVYLSQTTGNTIGPRNLISGNNGPGVIIDLGSDNEVFGNYIGTNGTGDGPLGNAVDGILINESAFNVIGGGDPSYRNVISGSRFAGAAGPNPNPATTAAAGVAIVGAGSYGNRVVGNYIGTNAGGTAAVPNAYDGVGISGATGNTIGGPGGELNLISGNGGVGVRIAATPASSSAGAGNVVVNNFIGTDRDGAFAIPNAWDGIFVNASSDNVIGQPGLGNLVSGNLWSGIHINGSTSTRNRVQGNFIGTGANGVGTIANGDWGVLIQNAEGNVVGGTGAGTDNVFGLNGNGNTETFFGLFPLPAGNTGGNVVVGNQHQGGGGGGHHAVPHGRHLVRFSRHGAPYRARAARQARPLPVTPQARPVVGAQHPLFLARKNAAPRLSN